MPWFSAESTGLSKAVLSIRQHPMPFALPGDRGVEGRDHLGDDRVRRAGPLIRAAGQGARVLDAVDRRREERVRRHVVDHHELVLRMAGEDRVVAVALVGRRARALLGQDLGEPAVQRYRCGRHARAAEEAPPRELALFLADLVSPVCCHLSSFASRRSRSRTNPERRRLRRHVPDHQFDVALASRFYHPSYRM